MQEPPVEAPDLGKRRQQLGTRDIRQRSGVNQASCSWWCLTTSRQNLFIVFIESKVTWWYCNVLYCWGRWSFQQSLPNKDAADDVIFGEGRSLNVPACSWRWQAVTPLFRHGLRLSADMSLPLRLPVLVDFVALLEFDICTSGLETCMFGIMVRPPYDHLSSCPLRSFT